MLSYKQCELARVMTQDQTSDAQINNEFQSLNLNDKISSTVAIDALLKLHDKPFDESLEIMLDDFVQIANKFSVSPATLFCVYMDNKK